MILEGMWTYRSFINRPALVGTVALQLPDEVEGDWARSGWQVLGCDGLAHCLEVLV